jgi:hypothetical protein
MIGDAGREERDREMGGGMARQKNALPALPQIARSRWSRGMRLTAKPVAAAHASKITRTANPNGDVAHASACATTTGEDEFAIAAPWAMSSGSTTFPCVAVLSSRRAIGALVTMAPPKLPHCD